METIDDLTQKTAEAPQSHAKPALCRPLRIRPIPSMLTAKEVAF